MKIEASNAKASEQEYREELQQLLYLLSHDLSAPLRHVREFSKLLVASISTPDQEQLQYGEFITAGVINLERKLEAILRLSRLGSSEEPKQQIETSGLMQELAEKLMRETGAKNVTFLIDPALPPVTGQLKQIEILFSELMKNSIAHRKPQQALCIKVTGVATSEFTTISIADDGPGIEEAHHDKVFKLFHQMQPGANPDCEGVGLAIARKIAGNQRADIDLESSIGAGAVFSVRFPI